MSFGVCITLNAQQYHIREWTDVDYDLYVGEVAREIYPLLASYRRDCYNDSIKVSLEKKPLEFAILKYSQYLPLNLVDFPSWYKTHKFCECGGDNIAWYVWLHKQPNFADFIEWCSKRKDTQ